MIRLDKYLADMSVGTRSEVKKLIKQGRVCVNGNTADRPEIKIDSDKDLVEVDGETVGYTANEYFMLNKPAGYVSATRDNEHKTVLELITDSKKSDLFPVGRLDIDTEGLLIITNDGELSHKLLSPKKHVDKTYFVIAKGEVTQGDILSLENGLDIGDEKETLPAKVANCNIVRWSELESYHQKICACLSKDRIYNDINVEEEMWTCLEFTIHEGRYHQVKRMMAAVGKPVVYLKRVSMGSLSLDKTLDYGEYRKLTSEELNSLRDC